MPDENSVTTWGNPFTTTNQNQTNNDFSSNFWQWNNFFTEESGTSTQNNNSSSFADSENNKDSEWTKMFNNINSNPFDLSDTNKQNNNEESANAESNMGSNTELNTETSTESSTNLNTGTNTESGTDLNSTKNDWANLAENTQNENNNIFKTSTENDTTNPEKNMSNENFWSENWGLNGTNTAIAGEASNTDFLNQGTNSPIQDNLSSNWKSNFFKQVDNNEVGENSSNVFKDINQESNNPDNLAPNTDSSSSSDTNFLNNDTNTELNGNTPNILNNETNQIDGGNTQNNENTFENSILNNNENQNSNSEIKSEDKFLEQFKPTNQWENSSETNIGSQNNIFWNPTNESQSEGQNISFEQKFGFSGQNNSWTPENSGMWDNLPTDYINKDNSWNNTQGDSDKNLINFFSSSSNSSTGWSIDLSDSNQPTSGTTNDNPGNGMNNIFSEEKPNNWSEPMQMQATLSLDQILDSELSSNPKYSSNNSVITPKGDTKGTVSNKSNKWVLVWIMLVLVLGVVGVLAFPSLIPGLNIPILGIGDAWDTSTSEDTWHFAPDDEWEFPDPDLPNPDLPDPDLPDTNLPDSESTWYNEGDTSVGWGSSPTVIEFPDPFDGTDDDERGWSTGWDTGWNDSSTKPIPYIWGDDDINIPDDDNDDSEWMLMDTIFSSISSFKSQAESYYSWGQETSDRKIVKYASQIIHACDDYEIQVSSWEWISQESLSEFEDRMNEIIKKIEDYNNWWGETPQVIQSNTETNEENSNSDEEELQDYLYSR